MTTIVELIEDSLRELNVISEVDTASAEQGAHGLRRLNGMLEMWRENDIDFGWFAQSDITEVIPAPDWMIDAIMYALAVRIAPTYGASISIELASNALETYSTVLRKSISEKLDNTDMSHMPQGTGQLGSGYDIMSDG